MPPPPHALPGNLTPEEAEIQALTERLKRNEKTVDDIARERQLAEISLELAEDTIGEIRKSMCPVPEEGEEGRN